MPKKKTTKSKQRLVPAPADGIVNIDAPYWRGSRAEDVLEQRKREKAAKKKAAKTRRRGRSKSDTHDSPAQAAHKRLRRLERALPRRKTLATRQRIANEIRMLRQELDVRHNEEELQKLIANDQQELEL